MLVKALESGDCAGLVNFFGQTIALEWVAPVSLPGCGVCADVEQEVANTKAKPALDVDSFQQLLAAAYVIQQQNEGASEVKARPDHSQVLAEIVETQKQIQTRLLDLPSAANLIAERVQRITQAAGVAVGVLEDDQVSYEAAVGSAADRAGSSVPFKSCLSANSIRHGEILQCPDAEGDFRLNPDLCRELGTKSLIAVPVYHEGKIAGVLEVRFAEARAFEEQDVRSSQLMAGLVAEAIARSAEQEWKQVLAVERATMLEALERIKPQLERLAETPAAETAAPPAPTPAAPAPVACRCGNWLRADESFCGLCGTPRNQERSASRDLQSKVASMWHMQQAAKQLDETAIEENVEPEQDEAWLPPALEEIAAAEEALEDVPEAPSPEVPRKMWPMVPRTQTVLEGEESLRILPADRTAVAEAYPWVSAAKARAWLESLKPRPESRAWMAGQWQMYRANIYLGVAIILLLAVCISTLAGWGSPPVHTASAALRPGVRVRIPQPQLSFFEWMLVALGLAEVPTQPVVVYQGNPAIQVWVDTRTALYYCPGEELYGKTDGGKMSTQRDAQLDQFEPAARKPCN
jgi:putative methionine-R-sulfoxide reductase with GAF domain